MMTQGQFDQYIKNHETIDSKTYMENKELFDRAEKQGRIRIKADSSQITDGHIKHPAFESYRIELIAQ